MSSAVSTVRARTPGSRGRRPKRYAPGRVCAEAGCLTVLSRYNRNEYCNLHRPVTYPRLRGVFTDDYLDRS